MARTLGGNEGVNVAGDDEVAAGEVTDESELFSFVFERARVAREPNPVLDHEMRKGTDSKTKNMIRTCFGAAPRDPGSRPRLADAGAKVVVEVGDGAEAAGGRPGTGGNPVLAISLMKSSISMSASLRNLRAASSCSF